MWNMSCHNARFKDGEMINVDRSKVLLRTQIERLSSIDYAAPVWFSLILMRFPNLCSHPQISNNVLNLENVWLDKYYIYF